jgi:hypothetical protein
MTAKEQNQNAATQTTEPNEGEGNRTAARRYEAATEKFVREGKVDGAAERAKEAVEGEERSELESAEQTGKARRKDI